MTDGQGRVLVVDVNQENWLKLSKDLKQQGYIVDLAKSGEQALEMLKAGAFDIVLLGISMPGLDGFQVLERIKNDSGLEDIPVIVISAPGDSDSMIRSLDMGAEDYLPTSFNPVLLRRRLDSSLQKKQLRELDKRTLQQEVALRQSEKLATLGRLSAGTAHELNNPATAAQRGAAQMQPTFSHLQQLYLKLSKHNLNDSQLEMLINYDRLAKEKAKQPVFMETLARSDREEEMETWLEEQGVENAWEIAPVLVNLGFEQAELAALVTALSPEQFEVAIDWLNSSGHFYSLMEEISSGARRISEIVKALKDYAYLDETPIQKVDLHASLDNTLVMLRGKLQPGVMVHRDYSADLPQIEAYGNELSQVWTNLIDNAIDAMKGKGEITLRTRHNNHEVIIEIEDNGPGIPEAVQAHIFDPFFTTKPPGQGTGLGLNISYNIIVQKHKGKIEVFSQPGKTRFEVRLPLQLAASEP